MGCTSSNPNLSPSLANSGKEHSFSEGGEEHAMEEIEMMQDVGLQPKGTKVLPTCDTVDEPDQVDSHSKSHTDPSSDLEKDSSENGHVAQGDIVQSNTCDPDMNAEDLQAEEKLSSLEDVVEKVVELYENGELDIKPNETEGTGVEEAQTKPQEHIEGAQEVKDDEKEETNKIRSEQLDDPAGGAASPTHSQSSRATRWEALADIAAELPPSLAVDPLTGQIYALSKH